MCVAPNICVVTCHSAADAPVNFYLKEKPLAGAQHAILQSIMCRVITVWVTDEPHKTTFQQQVTRNSEPKLPLGCAMSFQYMWYQLDIFAIHVCLHGDPIPDMPVGITVSSNVMYLYPNRKSNRITFPH